MLLSYMCYFNPKVFIYYNYHFYSWNLSFQHLEAILNSCVQNWQCLPMYVIQEKSLNAFIKIRYFNFSQPSINVQKYVFNYSLYIYKLNYVYFKFKKKNNWSFSNYILYRLVMFILNFKKIIDRFPMISFRSIIIFGLYLFTLAIWILLKYISIHSWISIFPFLKSTHTM